jgi:alpha-L-rhamnosidase
MTNPFEIIDLRCERFVDPIGLDIPRPRLSWRIETEGRNFRQRKYRIRAGTGPGKEDLWDSGWVESPFSQQISYEGLPVPSCSLVHWSVAIEDDAGQIATSNLATWEAGVGDAWSAHWIQAQIVGGPKSSTYLPYLRKSFQIVGKIRSARLYVTALGLYQARINGKRVGDIDLAPGWTDYRVRLRYQAYDVTELLHEGDNCLGAILGDGWYCGHIGWQDRQHYGDRPKLLAYLRVDLEDGTVLEIGSDSTWRFSTGSIQSADLLMGEIHDRRLEPKGWDLPDFDESLWRSVETVAVDVKLESQNSPPVRAVEELKPVSTNPRHVWPTDRYIFDLGQNMVGRVRLQLRGTPGQTLTIRYAERLDKNGQLYTENYRSARSVDSVTLAGDGLEVFEPSFTFHGFQYVEINGLTSPPEENTVTGVVLHSDLQSTGSFHSSDPLLNQLFSNIRWGWKGNSVDVPTDCPQRDERLGWTGDAQVFVRTASLVADAETFFEKFQQDLIDSQSERGMIPPVAPNPGLGEDGGPAWADAFVICPWVIYRQFGDSEILRRSYPAMKRWLESLQLSSREFIRSYEDFDQFKGFGDWLSTNADTPIDLIGTAFYAYSAQLMAQIAGALGLTEDSNEFLELAENVKLAFQKRFVTEAGLVVSSTQTSYVLALQFGLLPKESQAEAVKLLVKDIKSRGWKLSTGFVGTPYLLHVLKEHGQLDVAYKLLMQKEWPSFLYPVTQGATTIWERWDGWTEEKGFQDAGMNSFNHYAYGAVGDWLVSTVAGIGLDSKTPAFQKSNLAPRPGGGLTKAGASLVTRYGVLSSEWEIQADRFLWHVSIPPNTWAELSFPPEGSSFLVDGTPTTQNLHLGSGRCLLTAEWASE